MRFALEYKSFPLAKRQSSQSAWGKHVSILFTVSAMFLNLI